jgi:hypothetical protein
VGVRVFGGVAGPANKNRDSPVTSAERVCDRRRQAGATRGEVNKKNRAREHSGALTHILDRLISLPPPCHTKGIVVTK